MQAQLLLWDCSLAYLYGILPGMQSEALARFSTLYREFDAPITNWDCGVLCAPYNEYGVPFCCDARYAVPAAYQQEWVYLQHSTDLWRLWEGETKCETERLRKETPEGQVLIVCGGHTQCQRQYRSITCRAFPFFPYITREGLFVGLSYYWAYEDYCWVINHLAEVTQEYRVQFTAAYEKIFELFPEEQENFRHHSVVMRRIFGRKKRAIPLLHRHGGYYKVTPKNGRLRRVSPQEFPKHGPYKIAAQMPFPGET